MTDRLNRTHMPLDEMMEATRLASLGRIEESTALLQRSLFGFGGRPSREAGQSQAVEPQAIEVRAAPSSERRTGAAAAEGLVQAALTPERVRAAMGSVVRGLGKGVAPLLKSLEGLAGGDPGRAPMREEPAAPEPTPGPAGGSFVGRQFTSPAGAREYKLFVPSRPQRPAAPLVVMLHGCTQSPEDFATGTGMNALAERDGVFVAYPAQTRIANGQKCWNWYEPRDQGREGGETAIIAGLTRAVMTEHGIDPARVYIAGMSAGGAAAANGARAYPDLYAAVGIHSGLAAGCARDLSSALMAMQVGAPGPAAPSGGDGTATAGVGVPTIVFHGDDDGTVSARNADQILAQAGTAGLTPERETFEDAGHPFTRTRYTDRRDRVVVEDWRVRGAGHAWSGGDPRGSYTDARGPDASRAMLDFFAQHRLTPAKV